VIDLSCGVPFAEHVGIQGIHLTKDTVLRYNRTGFGMIRRFVDINKKRKTPHIMGANLA